MKDQLPATLQKLPKYVKYLMVAAVVAFISLLFPNNARFQYSFEKGQSWRYDDLYAPFDFAIKKTEGELNEERSRVRQEFAPIYQKKNDIAQEQVSGFESALQNLLADTSQADLIADILNSPARYINFGKNFLTDQLQSGIIDLQAEHRASGQLVQVLDGNLSKMQSVASLRTVNDAKADLRADLGRSRLAAADALVPLIEPRIVPNILFDQELTGKMLDAELNALSTSRGKVTKGSLVIPKDGIVTDEIYRSLTSFKDAYDDEITMQKSYWGVFAGYLLLTSLLIGILLLYLRHSARDIFNTFSKLLFILMWVVGFSYFVYVTETTDNISAYMIPFCIVPIVLKNFFNQRVALFVHVVIILIASFLSSLGYEFTFLNILAGIVAVLTLAETREWSKFFGSIGLIFLAYALGFIGLSLIVDGNVLALDYRALIWFVISAVLTLLAYPLIPLFSRVFGFTSSITLAELIDLNRPLLKELSIKAPGTMQHSLQVSNLAEAAGEKIGANSLLIKAAALYHDIGKMKEPQYFVENQSGTNPHDTLANNFESARKIIDHVTEGVKMAQKAKLPREIIDVIKTHHGTTMVEYFYRKQLQDFPDQEFDKTVFQYPGPKPVSKEQSILMLADSIEAAAKSLKQPTEKDINELIDKIIDFKVDKGQFELSELSFGELDQCRQIFASLLKSIYHVRIEYPDEQKKQDSSAGDASAPDDQPGAVGDSGSQAVST